MNWLAWILFAVAFMCIMRDLTDNGEPNENGVYYPKGSLFIVGVILALIGCYCSNVYYESKHSKETPVDDSVIERLCVKENIKVYYVDVKGQPREIKRCK